MYTILSIYNTSVHIFILNTFYFRVLVHLQKAVSSTILYICICMYIIFDSLGNYYFTTFLLSSHAVWYNNYIPSCISKSLYVTMGHMHTISNYAFTRICLKRILLNSTKLFLGFNPEKIIPDFSNSDLYLLLNSNLCLCRSLISVFW